MQQGFRPGLLKRYPPSRHLNSTQVVTCELTISCDGVFHGGCKDGDLSFCGSKYIMRRCCVYENGNEEERRREGEEEKERRREREENGKRQQTGNSMWMGLSV